MTPTTIDAVYQDGVFRPDVAPDLPEGTRVWVTVDATQVPQPQPLTGEALMELIRSAAAKFNPATDRPEVTSANVDAVLYGRKGDPGDVR
jgi:predicted DNA-binding antitoxin AbrB/MazE fold protein